MECGGIRLQLNISLNTYGAISQESGVKLYVYESIREDAHVCSDLGINMTGTVFLSPYLGIGCRPQHSKNNPFLPQLKGTGKCDRYGNAAVLQSVKGIGAKTAQRIIVDLKDKIKMTMRAVPSGYPQKNDLPKQAMHAVSALVMLGFVQTASQKVVSRILKESPTLTVESVIKEALKDYKIAIIQRF